MKRSRVVSASRLVALVALVVVLAGCAAPPPTPSSTSAGKPTATPSSSSTSASTSTPAAPAVPVAERLVFDSSGIRIISTEGDVLQSFTYFQPVGEVVPVLTTLFAAEPTVEDVQPYEGFPYTKYGWQGFTLNDVKQQTVDPYYVDFRVQASAASLNGVALETIESISVGDDIAPIETAHQQQVNHFTPSSTGIEMVSVGLDIRTLPDYVDTHGSYAASVFAQAYGPANGLIQQIYAPLGGGPGI